MKKSETIGHLAAALSKAQGQYKAIVRNCINPYFKSRYADLAAILDATREGLSKNDLSVTQTNEISDIGKLIVETTLLHSSGEWLSGTLSMRPVKDDPQGQGSCLTYMRRYTMQQILGVASEDEDDGQAASVPAKQDAQNTAYKWVDFGKDLADMGKDLAKTDTEKEEPVRESVEQPEKKKKRELTKTGKYFWKLLCEEYDNKLDVVKEAVKELTGKASLFECSDEEIEAGIAKLKEATGAGDANS